MPITIEECPDTVDQRAVILQRKREVKMRDLVGLTQGIRVDSFGFTFIIIAHPILLRM